MTVDPIDILAIAAHRDDVEQTCGGTLLKMAALGHRTGILDLTQGEMGSRGTADDRAREAEEAARILKVSWRAALDIPDGRVENTWENRLKVASVIRERRPRVVILPYWQGRHPDHYTCSTLGYEACFLAGLAKLGKTEEPKIGRTEEQLRNRRSGEPKNEGNYPTLNANSGRLGWGTQSVDELEAVSNLAPHRPYKIVYASLYYDIRPTFVVDISEHFEARFEALMAYRSQYENQEAGSKDFPLQEEIRQRLETMASFYGMLAGVKYGEPFIQKEVGVVEDLLDIPVKSI
jgi:LmbE family N-acetylglucosaminyl deacetylase